jgi:outer membrane lipoprotein LolB
VRHWVAGLAATTALAGCATPPPHGGDVLGGRLSVHVEASSVQPARSLSAGFELRGNATRGELDLTSPLGAVVARARWQPGLAELVTAEGTSGFLDLADLSSRTFGEPLPLAALFDWLRGRPWGAAPSQALAASAGFEQLGWQVDIARFAERQVVARRLAPPMVTLRVRLDVAP